MSDKEKRLRKILHGLQLKEKLLPVETIEEARYVMVNDSRDKHYNIFHKKEDYELYLRRGHNPPPPEKVYFLIPTDIRNRRQVDQYLLSNKGGQMRHVKK